MSKFRIESNGFVFQSGKIIIVRDAPQKNDEDPLSEKSRTLSVFTNQFKDTSGKALIEPSSVGFLYTDMNDEVTSTYLTNPDDRKRVKKLKATRMNLKSLTDAGWIWSDTYQSYLPPVLFLQEGYRTKLADFLRNLREELRVRGESPIFVFETGLITKLLFNVNSLYDRWGAYSPSTQREPTLLPFPDGMFFYYPSFREIFMKKEGFRPAVNAYKSRLVQIQRNRDAFEKHKIPDTRVLITDEESLAYLDEMESKAVDYVEKQGKLIPIVFDIETSKTLLKCIGFYSRILMKEPVSFYCSTNSRNKVIDRLISVLMNRDLFNPIAQNSKFDVTFLNEMFGCVISDYQDTMMMFRALHNNFQVSGLNFMASLYYPFYQPWKDGLQYVTLWDEGGDETVRKAMHYNGTDCVVTEEIYYRLNAALEKHGKDKLSGDLERFQEILARAGSLGIKINYENIQKFLDTIIPEYRRGLESLIELRDSRDNDFALKDVPSKLTTRKKKAAEYAALFEKKRITAENYQELIRIQFLTEKLNLQSSVQALNLLQFFIHPEIDSANKKWLEVFIRDKVNTEENLKFYSFYVGLKQIIFVLGYIMNILDTKPERLRTDLSLDAKTYRATSKARDLFEDEGGAMQNVSGRGIGLKDLDKPRDRVKLWGKEIEIPARYSMKSLFMAKEGYSLFNLDLVAADAWMVAGLLRECGNSAMLDELLAAKPKPHDIHTVNASVIFGKPIEEITKKERDSTKNFFYAGLYGANAYVLHTQVPTEPIHVADRVAKFFSNKYGLKLYEERIREELVLNKKVSSVFNQTFYFNDENDLKNAMNAPAQGGVAHIIMKIAKNFDDAKKQDETLKSIDLLNQTHDSLTYEVPIGEEERFNERMLNEFSRVEVPFPSGSFVIPIETDWGKTWG